MRKSKLVVAVLGLVLLSGLLIGCSSSSDALPASASVSQRKKPALPASASVSQQNKPALPASASVSQQNKPAAPPLPVRMVWQDFNGPELPVNGDKDTYPNQYAPEGQGTVSLESKDAVSGKSLHLRLTSGQIYLQFNPYNYRATPGYLSPRGFARDYSSDPASWRFNTYNRLRFWIKTPSSAHPMLTDGQVNLDVGTYVKSVQKPDFFSDEAGGGHYYHLLNVPNLGQWTQVVLNMHPSHLRGTSGGTEQGNKPHPTGEEKYNYFDTLTRLYISGRNIRPSSYPADYRLDDFEFYQEAAPENEKQVYSLTGTHVPKANRLIVTWSRYMDENKVKHEVRYAFSDIHRLGWEAAKPAPGGLVTPPGWQGYNSMFYDSSVLPLAGHSTVYIAIKPQNSKLFSQIAIPLKK